MKNEKSKRTNVEQPYEVYSSVGIVGIVRKLNHSIEELGGKPIEELARKAQHVSGILLSLTSVSSPSSYISYSQPQAEQFLIAEGLAQPLDESSTISYSQVNPTIGKLCHWQNSAIEKLNHSIVELGGKAQPLLALLPAEELFYVTKHYQTPELERTNPYAIVCAGYIGPFERDNAGHDIYIRELQQRGFLVYIKNSGPDGIYPVPDIYQFGANSRVTA